ncbi:MAG: uroporphyrinogen decarboxylase family protein [Fimbriimonadales bacterium]
MTSRERVLATFAHKEPDRVPIWCGCSVEFWEKSKTALGLDDEGLRERFGDDFRRVFGVYAGPDFPLRHPRANQRTPFGIEREGMGYGQPLEHPLQNATLEEVQAYPWPDPNWIDVSGVREEALSWKGEYAILGGDWSPFWHDLIDFLDLEGTYIRMHEEPEFVDAILTHMVDYYFEVSRRIFEAAADAIDIFFIGNDLGSQAGPLLSPGLFERFIVPHLKRLIDLGHLYGLKVQMHCCGGYAQLIPQLIAIGLDAVQAVQPCCAGMDLAKLKAESGNKIVFNGAIDSQHVLIAGNPGSVREDTRKVLEIMMPGGGYVAGASHDSILGETPVENVLAMCDAVRDFGRYGI